MAKNVAGDVYYEIDGQLHEIKRQLRQRGGYPYDPIYLKTALQKIIEGDLICKGNEKVSKERIPKVEYIFVRRKQPSDIVKQLEERGYRLATLDEVLGFRTHNSSFLEYKLLVLTRVADEFVATLITNGVGGSMIAYEIPKDGVDHDGYVAAVHM
jgi:hypothetical protein